MLGATSALVLTPSPPATTTSTKASAQMDSKHIDQETEKFQSTTDEEVPTSLTTQPTKAPTSTSSTQSSTEWEEVPPTPLAGVLTTFPLSSYSSSSSSSSTSSSSSNTPPAPPQDYIVVTIKEASPPPPPPPPPNPNTIKLGRAGSVDVSRVGLLVDDLNLSKPSARGGFGVVCKGVFKSTGQLVAVKLIGIDPESPDGKAEVINEIECHKRASLTTDHELHPLVLPVLESFVTDEYGCIITPFAQGGSLATLVEDLYQNVGMPREMALEFLFQIATALAHIHDRGVIHRDIKLDNVVLIPNGLGTYTIRFIDFGLAAQVTEENILKKRRGGTQPFAAPEILEVCEDSQEDIYSVEDAKKGDDYGLGMLGLSLFAGYGRPAADWDPKASWEGFKELTRRIGDPDIAQSILALVEPDLKKRISAKDFLNAAWPPVHEELEILPVKEAGRKRKREDAPESTVQTEQDNIDQPEQGPSEVLPSPQKRVKQKKKKEVVSVGEPSEPGGRRMKLRLRAPKKAV